MSLNYLQAQQVIPDTLAPQTSIDSTLSGSGDSLVLRGLSLFVVSKDSIDKPVDYGAEDKVIYDYAHKFIYLYKNGYINYGTIKLKADYIVIDLNKNIATAEPVLDSLNQKTGIPYFADGNQYFNAQQIRYNFKTKKGAISEVVTKQDDIYVHGLKTKFISKDNPESNGDDIIYNKQAVFTTCNHPNPHFGIKSKKQKLIPNKLVVVGPSNVQIHGVPTPLWLPFAFFPISKDRTAGLILPKNYTSDVQRGLGIKDFGYYWPINDYVDLKATGAIYLKGSWELNLFSNYKKRYKNNGNFDFRFGQTRFELEDSYLKQVQNSFELNWTHHQDRGANPYHNFGGQIHFVNNNYAKNIDPRAASPLQNTARSNMNYSHEFRGTPFSLNVGISHSQLINEKKVSLAFPVIDFNMRQIYPFRNAKRVSKTNKWYDQIALNYNSAATAIVNTYDSLLFTQNFFDTINYGTKHHLSSNVNLKLLKYFNLTPSINYDQEWFFAKHHKTLDPIYYYDSIAQRAYYGIVRDSITKEFNILQTMSSSLTLNTKLFGLIQSRRSWFRGIRHEISPSMSLNYAPDYHKNPFNYYAYVNTDTRRKFNRVEEYLIFANSPYGTNGTGSENFVMNFNVNNRVEMKYYTKKDSALHKLALLENVGFNASYNVFADSFKLSTISGNGSNRFFKGISNVQYFINWTPYARVIENNAERKIDVFAIKRDKKLLHMESASIRISTGSSVQQIKSLFKKSTSTSEETKNTLPSLGSLFKDINLNHNINFVWQRLPKGKDTSFIAFHSVNLTSGPLAITKKWKATIDNIGYDINAKRITYPSLVLERDLHCWTMRFDWQPQYKTYTFFIGVKPGSLEFIRIPNNQAFTGRR